MCDVAGCGAGPGSALVRAFHAARGCIACEALDVQTTAVELYQQLVSGGALAGGWETCIQGYQEEVDDHSKKKCRLKFFVLEVPMECLYSDDTDSMKNGVPPFCDPCMYHTVWRFAMA